MTPTPPQKEYIITEDKLRQLEMIFIYHNLEKDQPDVFTARSEFMKKVRSRPHTSTHLTKFVEHLSRINQELGVVSGKLENLTKIIDADEMTSDLWDDYANLEGWSEALDWAILTDSDFTLQQHDTTIRNATLKSLRVDLRTRFISSTNQWSKGRNSGLLECCNIIEESLRTQPQDQKP